ncbi:MAG: hypothetical protein GY755_21385 [Chloroflexi bacterium]|nr:hypothetical protein [Chloroflexota bacterium]
MFKETKIIFPLSLILATIFAIFEGGNYLLAWLPAALIFFLGLSALNALWQWTGKSRTLFWILALALLLRLVSAIALHVFLPINGYPDSEQQQAGYVFYDAFRRDTAAYDLAQSDAPIISAFSQKDHTDQYGGLLAFSAGAYRYLSPDAHRPLLIALFSAFAATLGIPFFWMAAKELGGNKLTNIATWIFALYPESILMGSSQMREPFLISFVAISLWTLLSWQKDKENRAAQIGLGIAFVGMLLISPAIAIITLVFLGVFIFIQNEKSTISPKQIVIALSLLLLSIFLLSSALGTTKLNSNSPLGIIVEWTQRAITWDIYQLERGSGWVQKLFEEMPTAIHIPFVTAYGLTQPVLPAAIIEPSTLIWRVLGILRAAGWYALAPFLLYGLFTLPKQDSPLARRVWTWFGLGSWFWIILASLRAGGDQWDNPRYRVIFIALQALFAAQAWIMHQKRRDAWLPRLLAVEVIFLAFFTQWYASRYYARFGTLSFGAMVMWILSLSALVIIGDIIRIRKKTL